MHSDLGSAPFGVDDLMSKGRHGAFPAGYLCSYLAHMRCSHAAAQADIDGIFAEVAGDPVELARLRKLRF